MTRQCFDEFHRLFGIRYPFGDYHQAFVPGVQRRRDGEPRLRHLPRPADLLLAGHPRRADPARHDRRPRDGAPVVRQHRHAEVVGRPVAQRVVRRVHGQPGHRRRHGVRRRLDAQRLRPPPVGADRRPAAEHPPGRRQRRRTTRRPPSRTSTASPTPRARASSSSSTPRSATRCSSPAPSTTSRRHRFGNATMHDLFASWEKAGAGDLSAFTGNWLRTAGPDTIVLDRAAGVVRRTPPAGAPGRPRAHLPGRDRVAGGQVGGPDAAGAGPRDAVRRAGRCARSCSTPTRTRWALVQPDAATVTRAQGAAARDRRHPAAGRDLEQRAQRLPQRRPRPGRRARPARGRHPGRGQRRRDLHDACRGRSNKVAPLAADPDAALAAGPRGRGGEGRARRPPARPCSCRRSRPRSSSAHGRRRAARAGWRAGDLPDGIELDLDLRWRVLVRLAVLGEIDRAELQAALAAEPTAASRVEHSRAMASLPDAEAKAWAWQRFTGEVDVPNYELEAAGLGHVAARPGGADGARTSTASSPTCPAPSTSAAAGCSPTPPRRSSRSTLAHGGDPARGRGRSATTRRSTCRCGAAWSTTPTSCARRLAIRRAYPAS